MIYDNYCSVRDQVDQAALKAGRDPKDVKLIAVSKTKPLSMIEELYQHGVRAFGENHVQELEEKQLAAPQKDIEWHFIGHLQRNKVKKLLSLNVSLIHSVDSLALAKTIEKEAAKQGRSVSILVELNIGKEESKMGAYPDTAVDLVKAISQECPHLLVKGLMCVAPAMDDEEKVRPYFAKMRQLKEEIGALGLDRVDMKELSMGMSGDYHAAIAEGATMVRVGTAIFGARDYSKK